MYEIEVTMKFRVVPKDGSQAAQKLRESWDEPEDIQSTLTGMAREAVHAASFTGWRIKKTNPTSHIYSS